MPRAGLFAHMCLLPSPLRALAGSVVSGQGKGAGPSWLLTPSCYITRSHGLLFMVPLYSQALGVI